VHLLVNKISIGLHISNNAQASSQLINIFKAQPTPTNWQTNVDETW